MLRFFLVNFTKNSKLI